MRFFLNYNNMFDPQWITAIGALIISVTTVIFGYMKWNQTVRFRGIELSLQLTKEELKDARKRIIELENKYFSTLTEVHILRATVARLEIGHTAGIITCNSKGIILNCNPVAEQITGYNKEQIIGQPLRILIPFRFRQLHNEKFEEIMNNERPLRLEVLEAFLLNMTGQEIPVKIYLTQWEENKEQIYGAEIRIRSI